MKVIEYQSIGKSPNPNLNEDDFVLADNFTAVIDGATSKSKRLINGMTTGKIAAKTLAHTIGMFDEAIRLEEALTLMTQAIHKIYQEHHLVETVTQNPNERATASVVIFSHYRKEIWIIGDCLCLMNNKVYTNPKKIDEITSLARALFLETEILKGKTIPELLENDLGRNYIFPLLEGQARFQNLKTKNQFTYEVLDGFPISPKKVKVVKVKSEELVLASDGYPKLLPSLAESEKYLSEILEKDPLCFRLFVSTKGKQPQNHSFDDRTYIRLRTK